MNTVEVKIETELVAPFPVPPTRKSVADALSRKPPIVLTRRQALLRGLALMGAASVGPGLAESNSLDITRHRLPTPGLREPMRVVQITDLHRSWCVSEGFIARVVTETNRLQPDAVALTGDFVTQDSAYIASCAGQLAGLRATLGVYGVLGNHDYWCDHGRGGPAVAEALAQANVHLLINRNVRLDNGLRLVGVDDFQAGTPDPWAAFADVGVNEPMLAMTHNPFAFGALCRYPCVTLAGHTHGGQINIPFLTRSYLGGRTRYQKGWFQEPNHPGRMYVSCGLGVIGLPMRFRCYPELAVFDLVPA